MDLTTAYLGLELRNPLVASAGPLTQTVDGVRAVADAGVGAVVLYSLFEEQLRGEVNRQIDLVERHSESFAEALDYFPDVAITTRSAAHTYLSLVSRAASAVDVPVIASLNGSDLGGWVQFARELADAGAAALELNVYFVPGDLTTVGSQVLHRHLEIVAAVKEAVRVPVAVKLSPYFSSPGNAALRIIDAGADGLVLFNRFLQPDVDVETLEVRSGFALSTPDEGRLPRTWIAALRHATTASLAGSTGVETADDVVRYLLAGADVVMTTASLVRHGVGHAGVLLDGLVAYLRRKEFASLDDVRGRLAVPAGSGDGYQRAGYVAALQQAKELYGALV